MFRLIKNLFKTGNKIQPSKQLTSEENKGKGLRHRLKKSYQYRTAMEMRNLRIAIDAAEDPTRPERTLLYSIYKEVLKDGQVLSQIRTSKNKVRAADFDLVDDKKKEHDAQKKLLEHPWFAQYTKLWVDTIFWGHSLIEFDPPNGEGYFEKVYLIPREYVHPWSGQLVFDINSVEGIPYREKPWNKYLMELGEPDDLGLLQVLAREAIWKNYSRTDWSRHSEKFGMPYITIKTTTKDEKEIDKLEDMASNFGSNGYAILDDEDDFSLVESSKTDAYKIYLEKVNYCDAQISKVISGQTGTSDEKSFVGSAEVHERILEEYILAMLRDFQDHCNFELFPFLIRHGYPLQGLMLQFTDLLPPKEGGSNGTPNPAPTPGKNGKLEKKKLSRRAGEHHKSAGGCCGGDKEPTTKLGKPIADLDKLMSQAIENVYKGKIKAGDLDADTWYENTKMLWDATNKGTGKSYAEIEYTDSAYELMTQLRYNAAVFAAFKNHSNIAEMVDALRDDKGELRSFEEYKIAAQPIYLNYNENWLEAEYNSAVASAQSALKWQDMWARRDLLPLLQYRAVQDERTRPAHLLMDGVTLPIEDTFWEQFMPPNGWGCRCTVIQLANGEIVPLDEKDMPSDKEVPDTFRNNPGISGRLFSEDNAYHKDIPEAKAKEIIAKMNKMMFDRLPAEIAKKRGELDALRFKDFLKTKYATQLGYDKESGGYLVLHEGHSMESETLSNEVRALTPLKEAGYACELRDERSNAANNQDANINGLIWDIKTIKDVDQKRDDNKAPFSSAISSLFKKAAKQGAYRVLLHIDQDIEDHALFARALKGSTNAYEVNDVLLIVGDKVVGILKRKELLDEKTILAKMKKAGV